MMIIGPALYFWMLGMQAMEPTSATTTTDILVKMPETKVSAVNVVQQSDGKWLVIAGGPDGYAASCLLSCEESPTKIATSKAIIWSDGKKQLDIALSCPERKSE
jgi:hypothetical protein